MEEPLFFYKFVPFERKDVLENGLIRFTPAQDFNDPFELNPTITPLSTHFIEYESSLSKEEQEKLSFRPEDYRYSSERDSKIESYKAKFKIEIAKQGILSLSSNNEINQLLTVTVPNKRDPRTNLLMWSHYADSHKGFVIEFESGFVQGGATLKKVNYREERHCITFEEIEENNFDDIFFRKSIEWGYEQEYRSVLPLDKAHTIVEDKFHLFKINKGKVRGITFGSGMSKENKATVMDIIKRDPEYSKVQFNHAYLNENGYMLGFYYDDGHLTNNPIYQGRTISSQIKF